MHKNYLKIKSTTVDLIATDSYISSVEGGWRRSSATKGPRPNVLAISGWPVGRRLEVSVNIFLGVVEMDRFVVIVFPNEAQAFEGTRVLKELHAAGNLTLYSMAVAVKDEAGQLAIKDAAGPGPLSTAVGALVGGLAGVLAGPVGIVAGSVGGSLIGSLFDIANYGVSADFLSQVSSELRSGKSAVIAEIVEDWTIPLDSRIDALGGTVLRTWRADFEDEQITKAIAAEKAEWEQLRDACAQASADAKANITKRLNLAKSNLEATKNKADAKMVAVGNELKAKVVAMEQQVATANADAKEKIRQRISAVSDDYQARSRKLKQAWSIAKEALAP